MYILALLFICVTSVLAQDDGLAGIATMHLPTKQEKFETHTTRGLLGQTKLPEDAKILEVIRRISSEDGFKAPRRGLTVEVKPIQMLGISRNNAQTIRVYVLEGQNLRHYTVVFPAFFGAPITQLQIPRPQRIKRCIRNKYVRRCQQLPLRRKRRCTDRVVRQCVPGSSVTVVKPAGLVNAPSSLLGATETQMPNISPEVTAGASVDASSTGDESIGQEEFE